MGFLAEYNQTNNVILSQSALGTRLIYQYGVNLGNTFAIFECILYEPQQSYLRDLYISDIKIAEQYDLPILIDLPTFRASERFLEKRSYPKCDVKRINHLCYDFIHSIRQEFAVYSKRIFISMPIGSMQDAYADYFDFTLQEVKNYHKLQIEALLTKDIDIINFLSFSNLIEAQACAELAAQYKVPYTISFILRKDAKLLDGTPIQKAIQLIDEAVAFAPLFYMISCTHTSTVKHAFKKYYPQYNRIKGIKANGSNLPPIKLKELDQPLADSADEFAKDIVELRNIYGWRILGGCCGTDTSHLEATAKLVQSHERSI